MSAYVGIRWESGELEVGFRAASRAEYLTHLSTVASVADQMWPENAPDLARDPAEPPTEGDFPEPPPNSYVEDALKREKLWRERQGLV